MGGPWWDSRLVVVLVCWLFVPLVLAWCLTAADWLRLFFPRYLIVTAAAPIALAALACAACPGRILRIVCAVLVTAAIVWDGDLLSQYQEDGRVLGDRCQDWRSAVAAINAAKERGPLPVLVRSGLIEADQLRKAPSESLREYCLLPVSGIYRIEPPHGELIPLPTSRAGRLTGDARQSVRDAGGAWFLLLATEDDMARIERDLLGGWGAIPGRPQIDVRESYGDVRLLRLGFVR